MRTHRHPVQQAFLPVTMIVSLVVGMMLTSDLSHRSDPSAVAEALAILAYACFVASFAIYCLGWLLRGHELWRLQQQRIDDEEHPTAHSS